tara:strand:+ start:1441 stop:1935 length:495 start_codon:yes stop_codon:yes gene_type:complete
MKTHEYLAEAGNLLAALMESEGVLTDEDEAKLEEWAAGTGDKLGAWRAVYRRAEAEAQIWKAEKGRIVAIQKRAESLMMRAKLAGVELLEARAELGEPTTIKGVCFLRKSQALSAPDELEDWPAGFLIHKAPSMDRAGALKALKAGDAIGDGFSIEERSSITWR